jgi:hypothetical protein
MELAVKLYSAVSNPLTIDNRIRLCRGALKNTLYRSGLKSLAVPLVVVQSTDNALVSGSNADVLVEGRPCRHVWSHEHEGAPSDGGDDGGSLVEALRHNVLLDGRAVHHLVVSVAAAVAAAVTVAAAVALDSLGCFYYYFLLRTGPASVSASTPASVSVSELRACCSHTSRRRWTTLATPWSSGSSAGTRFGRRARSSSCSCCTCWQTPPVHW